MIKRIVSLVVLAGCQPSGTPVSAPAVDTQPAFLGAVLDAAPAATDASPAPLDAASGPAAPSQSARRAHAEGAAGSVEIVVCVTPKGKSLGVEIAPKRSASWRAMLAGTSAATLDDQVRFVDVDHDGYPDPVVASERDIHRNKPCVPAVVYLTSNSKGAGGDCDDWLSADRGSEGFMVHAGTLDEAAAALAAVPRRGLTAKQACGFVDATAARSSVAVYGFPGSDGTLEHRSTDPDAVLSCRAKVPDGRGYLHPVVQCDAFRPYCEFGLASGGTTVPPTERRYWFDANAGKLIVVGVPEM